jgi:hypothetical protein
MFITTQRSLFLQNFSELSLTLGLAAVFVALGPMTLMASTQVVLVLLAAAMLPDHGFGWAFGS